MIRTATRLMYSNGYLDLGMVKEAALEIDAIDEKDRSSFEVLSMRVRLYSMSEDWSEMVDASKRLAEMEPEISFGWVNWAYAPNR